MLIKGHELGDELVVEIGKFSILWNCFERFHCDNFCKPAVIKKVCKKLSIDNDIQKELAEVLNERCSWFCPDIIHYVEYSLHPGNAHKSSHEDMVLMQDFLKQSGEKLSCGCLLVIYRIRNNLMHGMKCVEQLNNQLELFKAVNRVLESIDNGENEIY